MTEQESESVPREPELTLRDTLTDEDPQSEDPLSGGPAWGDSPATGVLAVDAALAEVAGVDGLPLDEQLAAFERAHDRLRSALDSEPGDPA